MACGGRYEKKEGKSNGVLALMDNLAKELSDSIAEAKHDEETSQRDYESLMARSQSAAAILQRGSRGTAWTVESLH